MFQWNKLLIRYGELGLKSSSVRKYMERKLAHLIFTCLIKSHIPKEFFTVEHSWGRLYIAFHRDSFTRTEADNYISESIQAIQQSVFGIISLSPTIETQAKMDNIVKVSRKIAEQNLPANCSFAVNARRIGQHDFSSQDVGRIVGAEIMEHFEEKRDIGVDLTNPDYTLFVEIRDKKAYVFDKKIAGFGGLPQGTQGTMAVILRGSGEDAIAGFLLSKRGASTIPVLFINEKSSNKSTLEIFLKKYYQFNSKLKMPYYHVNFQEIIDYLGYETIRCSICDQICYHIIIKALKKHKIEGVIAGNAVDTIIRRVPYQSNVKNNPPMYYPLIALSPEEIRHPFKNNFSNSFCLESCPGYENQKKKGKQLLSQQELTDLVAEIAIHEKVYFDSKIINGDGML